MLRNITDDVPVPPGPPGQAGFHSEESQELQPYHTRYSE